MKKVIILISILLTVTIGFVIYKKIYNPDLKYSQEYVVGEGNIKGNVDVNLFESKSSDFLIGANKNGYAVFKNPSKAFKRLKMDYSKGLNLIQKEFDLKKLSQFNYKQYGIYGIQVTTGTEEEKNEAKFISLFMDIYENSFK